MNRFSKQTLDLMRIDAVEVRINYSFGDNQDHLVCDVGRCVLDLADEVERLQSLLDKQSQDTQSDSDFYSAP